MRTKLRWRSSFLAKIIVLSIVLCSTRVVGAAGFLGLSYEDCVAEFGEPVSHDVGYGGDSYKFRKEGWEYGIVFLNRVVAAIMFMKADSSPVPLSDLESLKNIYSDGLPWNEQQHGKKLVRADHRVYLEQTLSTVLIYTPEFRRSARSP